MKVTISLLGKKRYFLRESDVEYDNQDESFDKFIRKISSYMRMKKNFCNEGDGRIHPVKFKCLYNARKRELEIVPASSPSLFGLFTTHSNSIEEALSDFKLMCKENDISISEKGRDSRLKEEREPLLGLGTKTYD